MISSPRLRLAARLTSLSLISAWLVGWCWESSATASATAPTTEPSPTAAALRFERNQGQLAPDVRFALRGNGYGVYLTPRGATLALRRNGETQQSVSLRLVGAREVEPLGDQSLPGVSNYFVGSDRARWQEGVESFARVRYRGALPGVDVVYYGSQARELEYDLELAPGTKPELVSMELDGARAVSLSPEGDALVTLPDGSTLRKHRPVAYQVDASGARRVVPSRFRLVERARLGFELGAYDASKPLVIDPTLSYSTYLGGSRFDELYAVGADAAGNTYAVGYTTGTLFPTRDAAQNVYGGGASDAIVCKLKADGSGLIYATYLGGRDTDRAYSVGVDAAGSAYISGLTFSNDFPTAAALQSVAGGGQDAFLTKLSATGALIYSTYLGGGGDDLAQAVAVRPNGEAFVTGATFSANFPVVSAVQPSLKGTSDAFVARFSTSGATLLYSSYLGGTGNELGQGIAVDSAGTAYIAGQTGSSNFPTLLPIQATYGGGSSDAFVTKLAPSGSTLVYSSYLGGTSSDVATGVAQVGGAALVAGYTSSFNFPISGGDQPSLAGSSDAFVSRINTAGGVLDYSVYLGGSGSDAATGIAVDQNNYVHVSGQTSSTNFPVVAPITGQASLQGASDGFIAALSGSGSRIYVSYLGGSATDSVVGVALGGPTLLHALGNTLSSNIPIVGTPLFGTPPGSQDGFIARLATPSLSPAPASGPRDAVLLALLLLGCALGGATLKRTLPQE